MYMTEALANLEGLERGPAGNTALAAAFSLAQEMPEDAIIVISETEYTGAGKHIQPQLDFARDNGIEIKFGNPQAEDKPGVNIVLPENPGLIKHQVADINRFRQSMIKRACKEAGVAPENLTAEDIAYLAEETKTDAQFVKATLELA